MNVENEVIGYIDERDNSQQWTKFLNIAVSDSVFPRLNIIDIRSKITV